MPLRKGIPFIFLCALSSCMISMSKEEQLQYILSTPSIESSEETALESTLFARADWPAKNWWEQYDSAELNRLIETALQNNPSIQQVQQRIQYAASEAVIARSEYMPLIYFNATDQWSYLSKNGLYRALNPDIDLNNSQIDFSLSFSYEFDFWGKYHNLYYAALDRQKAAEAETAQVELITAASLAQAFLALKTNLVRKELYEKLYQVRKDYFELQNKMRESALYSLLEPLLSQEMVFEAEKLLYAIDQEIEVGKHLVNILAGLGPDTPLQLGGPLPLLPKQLLVPDEVSLELLSRRPDVAAQIWRLDALARDVGAAKADFWPNVNILALIGFESNSWSKLFDWASKMVSALPGLSLPLYTAGAIGANVDAKKALFYESVYQYNDLILQSFQQVSDLLSIGRSVYGQKEKQMLIVRNASARYNLGLLRQNSGIDNALSTYTFLEEWIQKELDNILLLYQQYAVSVGLTKALGGGYVLNRGSDD